MPKVGNEQSQRRGLMQPRRRTAEDFGCSVDTIMRMERDGRLTPIKLKRNSPTAPTFHDIDEVMALKAQLVEEAKAAAKVAREAAPKRRRPAKQGGRK